MPLTFNIEVTSIPVTTELGTVQQINKRLEYVKYTLEVPQSDVPLEYVAFDALIASQAISIVDRSSGFRNNAVNPTAIRSLIKTVTGKTFFSNSKTIQATNQYNTLTDGTVLPLFYKHLLPVNTVSFSVNKVTSTGSSSVDKTYYKGSTELTTVYGAFQNTFDEESGRYTLYYVSSIDSSGNSSNQLWDSLPALTEATIEDIDPETGLLIEDHGVYTRQVSGNGYLFTFVTGTTFFIRELFANRIFLKLPALEEPSNPWYLGVEAGSFVQEIGGVRHVYYVEEYDHQNFIPASPYRFTAYEKAIKVTKNVVKLQREKAFIDPEAQGHLDLLILDKETQSVVYALTTNTLKEGLKYGDTDIKFDSTRINDWDTEVSLVVIDDFTVLDRYELRASYSYSSTDYEFTMIDFNPVNNPSIVDQLVVIYLVPDLRGSDESSVFYLLVKDGIITYANQPALNEFTTACEPNSNSVVGTSYEAFPSTYDSILSFRELYPSYLILGEVTVLNPFRIEDAVRIDCRTDGGGIEASALEDAVLSNYKVAYFSGVAPVGGYTYPQLKTHVVKVPYTLLTEYGGVLTEGHIKKLLEHSLAAGEYIVLDWCGVIPTVTSISAGGCISLVWAREDPAYGFNVYRSPFIDKEFELIDTVAGSLYSENTYEDCTVNPDTIYYYKVTATLGDIESPPSVVYGAKSL